ncbi:PhoH family protein [gamma proteobacterium HdN1]|nr:PhoH family protein [gamma proteobacterium HdN1]
MSAAIPPPSVVQDLYLEPYDSRRLAKLCGTLNSHLKQIEARLSVAIHNRGNHFQLIGSAPAVEHAVGVLKSLYPATIGRSEIAPETVHLHLRESLMREDTVDISSVDEPLSEGTRARTHAPDSSEQDTESSELAIHTRKGSIRPRGEHQKEYVRNIFRYDINFGIGPAGTGKTYLAVACAVDALEQEQVKRILLVRPAVEAGEKLGFLPGDLSEKINPYLRPLYDALYEMMGFERVAKLLERQVIEVCPLAYMRGRTLNNAFIIMDESQNTTREQMKMFLTRIGFGSKAVITGDYTQIDLPRGTQSGLLHAMDVLQGIKGIGFTQFSSRDVVRHTLVQKIVEAYDAFEQNDKSDRPHRGLAASPHDAKKDET